MNSRIRKLRKTLDLTQQEFSNRIGTTANVLTNYETGRRNPSNSVINNICKTFNVNEEWLRTGQGEMFLQTTDSILDTLAEKYNLSYEVRILIEEFINLKPDIQQIFVDYALNIAKALQKENKELGRKLHTQQNIGNMETTSELAPSMPNVTQDVMSKLAEMEQQNKKLLARLEILEKEGVLEKEQTKQSMSSVRSHIQ